MNLRINRNALRISQSRLSHLSGVSRFKICIFELGEGNLTNDEIVRINLALEAEAERLKALPSNIQLKPIGAAQEVGVS